MSEPGPLVVDSREAAQASGLIYVSSDDPGLTRRRAGKGFSYRDVAGQPLRDREALKRIRALVIPPAWSEVWICATPDGHLQALGHDERGRRQYIYHPRFREIRDGAKFEHVLAFAEALPGLRAQVARDMARPGLGRSKVLATVVHLLEATMIRVGNASYARENKSYGLTTLLNRHVQVDGADLKFHFKGKSGREWRLGLHDRRITRIVKSCQELPGQQLFQYLDDAGQRQAVTSTDVNAYLREISGADITAKDFRTWAGTVLAAVALIDQEALENPTASKRHLKAVIDEVSARLGNTPTICRKGYIHPEILTAYLDGDLRLTVAADDGDGVSEHLPPEEAAVLAFLRARSARKAEAPAGHGRRKRSTRRSIECGIASHTRRDTGLGEMAKGQKKSNKEIRKPKTAKAKPAASTKEFLTPPKKGK